MKRLCPKCQTVINRKLFYNAGPLKFRIDVYLTKDFHLTDSSKCLREECRIHYDISCVRAELSSGKQLIISFMKNYYIYLINKHKTVCHLSLKGRKSQRFLIIHLIEFIQINNFHIYSIF